MTTVKSQPKALAQVEFSARPVLSALRLADAAERLGVSPATIRNWLKAGYLHTAGKGRVTLDSLEHFLATVAGQEKLVMRANKSLKDTHNHDELVFSIVKDLHLERQGSKLLGMRYEQGLSNAYRNKEGVYYTPQWVVNDLFTGIPRDTFAEKTFCDPCCGSGNFIERALDLGFKPHNIFAFDLDPLAVELTQERIFEKTGYLSKNIRTLDFLDLVVEGQSTRYDVIFTNPPWGKKITKKKRQALAAALKAGQSRDTCALFFFACLQALRSKGVLGLVLPEAFFTIASYASARSSALQYRLERLIDYGKPFKGLLTRAQALVLSKQSSEQKDTISCESGDMRYQRTRSSFCANPKSIFNLHCSPEDAQVLSHILSIPHLTLQGRARWGLGIVTGNNKKFIQTRPGTGLMPVLKGADIKNDGLQQASCFIPQDLALYQQVAPVELFEAREKIIYKFISSKLCFFYDDQQRYILNSANMLLPDEDFPVRPKVVSALLSSTLMTWIFQKIFSTHKILKADLETLPIHAQFLQGAVFDYHALLHQLNLVETPDGAFRIKKREKS